jgi:hypothetical protein
MCLRSGNHFLKVAWNFVIFSFSQKWPFIPKLGVRALYLISRKLAFRRYSFGANLEDNRKCFNLFISISFTAAFILKSMGCYHSKVQGSTHFYPVLINGSVSEHLK